MYAKFHNDRLRNGWDITLWNFAKTRTNKQTHTQTNTQTNRQTWALQYLALPLWGRGNYLYLTIMWWERTQFSNSTFWRLVFSHSWFRIHLQLDFVSLEMNYEPLVWEHQSPKCFGGEPTSPCCSRPVCRETACDTRPPPNIPKTVFLKNIYQSNNKIRLAGPQSAGWRSGCRILIRGGGGGSIFLHLEESTLRGKGNPDRVGTPWICHRVVL